MSTTASAPVVFKIDVSPPAPAPEFNVEEKVDAFDVTGDMKDRDNIRVAITEQRILAIVGEQTQAIQLNVDGEAKTVTETVQYQRFMPVPDSVDESAIWAKMNEERQLQLCMPKKQLLLTAPKSMVGGV